MNTLEKENGFAITYYVLYVSHQLIDRVIDQFINSTRTFFICLKMFVVQCRNIIKANKITKKEWILFDML